MESEQTWESPKILVDNTKYTDGKRAQNIKS